MPPLSRRAAATASSPPKIRRARTTRPSHISTTPTPSRSASSSVTAVATPARASARASAMGPGSITSTGPSCSRAATHSASGPSLAAKTRLSSPRTAGTMSSPRTGKNRSGSSRRMLRFPAGPSAGSWTCLVKSSGRSSASAMRRAGPKCWRSAATASAGCSRSHSISTVRARVRYQPSSRTPRSVRAPNSMPSRAIIDPAPSNPGARVARSWCSLQPYLPITLPHKRMRAVAWHQRNCP